MAGQILLVDDDPIVLRGMKRTLERGGWTVFVEADAPGALRFLESESAPDATIVDYDLGDHDGLPVLLWMRDNLPSTVRILMTGHDDLPLVVDAINRGQAFQVLRKPFHQTELFEVLARANVTVERIATASSQLKTAEDRSERRAIENALAPEALRFALQPIVEARTREPVAVEALLRPATTGFTHPIALIEAVERQNLVPQFGQAVLKLAEGVLERIPENQQLFINLHPAQLEDPESLARAMAPLEKASFRVTFEITERSRLQDIANWETSIQQIQRAGFSLAVDDLGSGYSALSMLADLQPRYIKLDMGLVRGVDASRRKQRLIQLMVTFADATAATIVAEGVETEQELETLVDCGVPLLQGYLLGRPEVDPVL